MTRPDETMVSKMAKAFKKLSPAERVDFVVFTWGNMNPALTAALKAGKITFEFDLEDGDPPLKLGGAKPAKAKGAAYVAEQKAKAPPKPPKAEPAGDAKPPAKGKATPAAKKAPTAPAKGKKAA
jgi:hypothetical protein